MTFVMQHVILLEKPIIHLSYHSPNHFHNSDAMNNPPLNSRVEIHIPNMMLVQFLDLQLEFMTCPRPNSIYNEDDLP